jgi:lysozyme
MARLTPKRVTYLKTAPLQIAANRGKSGFQFFKVPLTEPDGSPKTLAISPNCFSPDIDGHALLTFEKGLSVGGIIYQKLYIATCDWAGFEEIIKVKISTPSKNSAAGSSRLILPVTYRSQVDNSDDTGQGPGWRQCQATSVVMMLEAWKGLPWLLEKSKGYSQPEDWYCTKLALYGDTTDGGAHVRLLNELGYRCTYRTDLTVQDGNELIDRELGSAIGTEYKRHLPGGGGHICYMVGRDLVKGGFYLHDPYGVRMLTDTQALDDWETIGGPGGAERYFNLAVIKDCWISQGDGSGWGVWPDDGIYGHSYKKPSVTIPTIAKSTGNIPSSGPRRYKPQEFRCNSKAIAFITHFEGCELSQYYCSSNVSTIGLGATRWHDGGPIPVGATITREQAVKFFERDSAEFIAEIQRLIDVPLSGRQVAALLSFAYNCGSAGFAESSLRESINAGASFEAIRANFRKWCKGPDGVLPGLLRRRNAEAMLWEGRDDWDKASYNNCTARSPSATSASQP